MTTSNELAKRTLTLTRTFEHPVQIVWDAWTQPGHIAQWWGPKGMPVEIVQHDFSVGGTWKYKMEMPGGGDFISEGSYSEIIPLEKIVTSADFKPMTEGVIIEALFEADGDRTHFTFNCIHATIAYRDQQEKMGFYNGWGSALERLATLLATINHQ
jgi:uncharacterized protein YndB with AHSA1/START domain